MKTLTDEQLKEWEKNRKYVDRTEPNTYGRAIASIKLSGFLDSIEPILWEMIRHKTEKAVD